MFFIISIQNEHTSRQLHFEDTIWDHSSTDRPTIKSLLGKFETIQDQLKQHSKVYKKAEQYRMEAAQVYHELFADYKAVYNETEKLLGRIQDKEDPLPPEARKVLLKQVDEGVELMLAYMKDLRAQSRGLHERELDAAYAFMCTQRMRHRGLVEEARVLGEVDDHNILARKRKAGVEIVRQRQREALKKEYEDSKARRDREELIEWKKAQHRAALQKLEEESQGIAKANEDDAELEAILNRAIDFTNDEDCVSELGDAEKASEYPYLGKDLDIFIQIIHLSID